MNDGDSRPTDAVEILIEQQRVIDYIRSVVKCYVDSYQMIEAKLLDAQDAGATEEESDILLHSLDQEVQHCLECLQPVLTLWEDTQPENITTTLAGNKLKNLKRSEVTFLN